MNIFYYKKIVVLLVLVLVTFLPSCTSHQQSEASSTVADSAVYTCPMHPQIIRSQPGDCPICGMTLVKQNDTHAAALKDVQLENLLKPTNQFVVSDIPVISVSQKSADIPVKALGTIAYNTSAAGTISARVTGRIEKLYILYKFQLVQKGQKIMEIYSPELLTAQQNLLFLLQHDAENTTLVNAAKQKLLWLGMSTEQMQQVMQTRKIAYTVTVYSNYTGHIHEAGNENMAAPVSVVMKDVTLRTKELSIKAGMYVERGQTIFTVFNPDKAWVLLNIYASDLSLVQKGATATITPETAPDKAFKSTINFIEPFYRNNSKTLTARIDFNNTTRHIPIGSQVNAVIAAHIANAYWLPVNAVVSLGVDKIVFIKEDGGFRARKIVTGVTTNNEIQIIAGLTSTNQVATNAQYLMDSESFIKLKN